MKAFLKKYWPFLALFASLGVIMFLMQALDRENNEVIANLMADKAMAKHRAASQAIVAKYAPINAALAQQAVALQQGNVALAAKVVVKQKALILKDGTLIETRAKLAECSAFLGSISYEYNEQLVKADKLRLDQLAAKDAEIADWMARDERSTKTIGELTKRVVKLTLENRKRLAFGPQGGYGTGGAYAGFGATYVLFRFKAPGQ
jgi:hypothetical protein